MPNQDLLKLVQEADASLDWKPFDEHCAARVNQHDDAIFAEKERTWQVRHKMNQIGERLHEQLDMSMLEMTSVLKAFNEQKGWREKLAFAKHLGLNIDEEKYELEKLFARPDESVVEDPFWTLAWTDGSYTRVPERCGFGVYYGPDDPRNAHCPITDGHKSNNRAELHATMAPFHPKKQKRCALTRPSLLHRAYTCRNPRSGRIAAEFKAPGPQTDAAAS
jgi:hypothetical protein